METFESGSDFKAEQEKQLPFMNLPMFFLPSNSSDFRLGAVCEQE
jgi:hypothetical protein